MSSFFLILLTVFLSGTFSPSRAQSVDPYNLRMPDGFPVQKYPGSRIVSVTERSPVATASLPLTNSAGGARIWCAFTCRSLVDVMEFYRRYLNSNRWRIDYDSAGSDVGLLRASSGENTFDLSYVVIKHPTQPVKTQFFLDARVDSGSTEPFSIFGQCPQSELQSSTRTATGAQAQTQPAAYSGVTTTGSGQKTIVIEQFSNDPRNNVLDYYRTKLDDLGWTVSADTNWRSLSARRGATSIEVKYDEGSSSRFTLTFTR